LLPALSGLLLATLSGLLGLLARLLLAAAALLPAALLATLLLLTLSTLLAGALATLIGIVHDRSCMRLAPTSLNGIRRGKFLPCCRLASRSRSCGQAPHEFFSLLKRFLSHSADQVAQSRRPAERGWIDITHVSGAWDWIGRHIAVMTAIIAVIVGCNHVARDGANAISAPGAAEAVRLRGRKGCHEARGNSHQRESLSHRVIGPAISITDW
jgi:hypothetical protein